MRVPSALRRPGARLVALALAAAALTAAPSPAQAGSYTFTGFSSPSWSFNYGGFYYYNWLGGLMPVSAYDTDIHLGTIASVGTLASVMDYGSFSLRSLSLDAPSGVSLTGGAIRIAGGGSVLGGNAVSTIANALVLNANGATTSTSVTFSGGKGGTLTATGVVSGSGGIGKTGLGTLLLGATNTYTGGTTIAAGTIQAGADDALGAGDLTLTGGTLALNGRTVSVKNLNLGDGSARSVGTVSGSGTLNLGGDVTFRVAESGTVPALISANLALSAGQHAFNDNGIYSSSILYDEVLSGTISGAGGLDKNGSTYLALTGHSTYAGATNVNGGVLFLGAINALPTGTALSVAPDAQLRLDPYTNESGVVGGDYNQTVGSLSGAGDVFLGSATLTVGDATSTTFSGRIASYGDGVALVKQGSGTFTLSGRNTYTGGTTIAAGTIRAGAENVLPKTGDLTLAGGTLALNGYGITVRDLNLGDGSAKSVGTISGAGTLSLGGNVTFRGASSFATAPALISANISLTAGQHAFNDNGNFSSALYDEVFSGAISGAGGLDKNGREHLALTGHSTYAGATNVNGGILFLGATNALPASTALTVASGAVLRLDPYTNGNGVTAGFYSQTVGSLSGAGAVFLGSATLTVGDATSTTFSGRIGDGAFTGGSLVKQGTGTLTLSGANTYTGGTKVVGGTLAVGSTAALPKAGAVALGGAGTLALNVPGSVIGALTGTGNLALGANSLSFGNGGASFAFGGAVTGSGTLDKLGVGRADLGAADLSGLTGTVRVDGGTLTGNAGFKGAVALNGGTYEVAGGGALTSAFSGKGSFVKSGAGTLLVGSQAFVGTTSVTGGGLTMRAGSFFGSDGGFAVASGASVRLGSFDTALSGATYANAGTLQGTGEIDATLANAGTGRINLAATDALTIGKGANSNAGLIGVAGGALTVRGTLANTGQISGHGSLDFGDGLSVGSGGSLAASGGLTDVFGRVAIGSASARAGAVVSAGGGTLTFHDDVTNNGLASTGVQTDLGSRTVFLGSVSGAGPFTGAGAVEFDGDLRPGNSPARVTFSGDTTLGGTNRLFMELGGTVGGTGYDQIDFAGRGHLGGALTLASYGGFTPGMGQSFDLFDGIWDGTFASVDLPTLSDGLRWDASALYTTGVVRVQSVPEPSALAALGLGGLVMLRRRRR